MKSFSIVGRRYSASSSRRFSPFFSDRFERRGLVYVGSSIQHKTASDAVFAEYGFTWDAGNRITEFETVDGTAEYTYDKTGQLTGADYDYITDELYTYDDNGNRTNAGYVTGENNETLSDGVYRYSYDNEGNRTEKFLWTDTNNDGVIDASEKTLVQSYEWDYRNRLSSVTNYESGIAKEVIDYLYDYLNLMIERTVADAATSALQSSDFNIYSNGQIVLEYDTTSSVDVVKSVNLWGANIDELVAVEQIAQSVNDNNVVLWTYGDHLNSIRDVVLYDSITQTATVVNHLIYNAFGILVSSTDGNSNNPTSISPLLKYRYTGKFFDDSTGLQNNINRWYDNTTGKWLSSDPISFGSGDFNTYRYCSNDSIAMFDFWGYSQITCLNNMPLGKPSLGEQIANNLVSSLSSLKINENITAIKNKIEGINNNIKETIHKGLAPIKKLPGVGKIDDFINKQIDNLKSKISELNNKYNPLKDSKLEVKSTKTNKQHTHIINGKTICVNEYKNWVKFKIGDIHFGTMVSIGSVGSLPILAKIEGKLNVSDMYVEWFQVDGHDNYGYSYRGTATLTGTVKVGTWKNILNFISLPKQYILPDWSFSVYAEGSFNHQLTIGTQNGKPKLSGGTVIKVSLNGEFEGVNLSGQLIDIAFSLP